MDLKEKQRRLKEIANQVERCRKCSLWKNPKAVPGEGDPEAEIMLIGEAPGYHESVQGKPFVGAAGQLLTQLLKSIGLERTQVFICNILKHRPPENRDPLPQEVEACTPFLDEQIEIVDPKIIVTLGRFSLNKFLPHEYISKIHGQARFIDFGGLPAGRQGKKRIIIPMYHPAAALRSSIIMEEIKKDFQKISQFLSEEINLSAEKQLPDKEVEKKSKQMSFL